MKIIANRDLFSIALAPFSAIAAEPKFSVGTH